VHIVARNFCTQHADSLGYTADTILTDTNINKCVSPVLDYLVHAVARNFCIQQADSLGHKKNEDILTDAFIDKCVSPIADHLYAAAFDKLSADI
jgi:hypothetical protein